MSCPHLCCVVPLDESHQHLFGPEECPVCAAMSDLRTDRDRLARALDRQTRTLARTLNRIAELEHQLEGGDHDR